MPGYDENFLKTPVPLPGFALRLDGKVLRRDSLRDEIFADYINYTIVMHAEHRSPIYAALNINQSQFKSVKRGGWNIDTRVGGKNQLDNDYYYRNRWDRGHIARRSSAAWGEDTRAAKAASDATMFYTNACLQFDSFNQDEWLDLEDWVKHLQDDTDDRISVFSGPIYGEESLFVVPRGGGDAAEVPAAFFKIVCFTNRKGEFEVRAFNVPQDQKAMADWQGKNRVDRQSYQTTVAEIEHLTGLAFPDIVAERNPLLFHDTAANREKSDALKIDVLPENIPVDRPADMKAAEDVRTVIADDQVDVFIAGALPNPTGRDRGKEWVSIINLEEKAVDLGGWELSDNAASVTLSGRLQPGVAIRIQGAAMGRLALSNKADILTLSDAEGRRIDRVRWFEGEARPGHALFFPSRRRDETPLAHRTADNV